MSEPEAPKIEFPCEGYPIKIMGEAGADFQQYAIEVIETHAPGFDRTRVSVRASRNGRFESVHVEITATGTDQLTAIFEDLKKHDSVRMVL